MAFWSNQTLSKRLKADEIVTDFDPECVKYCAYELKLGDEVFLTSSDDGGKTLIDANCQITIPPGQLALLITKETIKIPPKVIGFISIKASDKFRGLVNISGFHVDPGFKGRLKFSVYNAGGQNIILTRDAAIFLVFFADLDLPADPLYAGEHNNQTSITSKDVMQMQGRLASPAVLDDRMKKLETLVEIWTRVFQTLGAGGLLLLIGLCVRSCGTKDLESPKGMQSNTPTNVILTTQQPATTFSVPLAPVGIGNPGSQITTNPNALAIPAPESKQTGLGVNVKTN